MSKKVYIVLHTMDVGGAERHASSIANYLAEHGYRVTIILLDNDVVAYQLSENVRVAALCNMEFPETIREYRPGVLTSAKLKLYKALSPQRYQVLDKYLYLYSRYISRLETFFANEQGAEESIAISFMPLPNLSCAAVKRKIHFKLILGEFSSPQVEFPADAPENRLKRELFPNVDGFVFQTEEQMAFYDYLPAVKKAVIPNPLEEIDVQPYEGVRNREIVNFCRLVEAKNLPLLIRAFSLLAPQYPEHRLVIYGDGPEKQKLEEMIEGLGLSSRVMLPGAKKDVLSLVRECAMFVSSSDREGISNSMLEAMAIGLPTVCTDCPAGGARMFIEPYRNGILVPVRDQEALAAAMRYMIDYPEEAAEMGKNAVSIKEKLKKEIILEKWKSFLESV